MVNGATISWQGEPRCKERRVGRLRERWLLGAAVAAAMVLRIPAWRNCTDVLDSDVACNGLTLQGMLEGQWRWHLPGIHYMGVTEVVLALPAAALLGANPYTLMTGPLIGYALYMGAVFFLVRRLYGSRAAGWSLAATTLVSPDVLFWSNFPIGGHVLITFWHLTALLLVLSYVRNGRDRWLAALGVWCGLGFYTYQMYLYTIAMLVPVILLVRVGAEERHVSLGGVVLVLAGFAVGWVPHWIGVYADAWDVYGSQIGLGAGGVEMLRLRVANNLRLLYEECLPQLIAGQSTAELRSTPVSVQSALGSVAAGLWAVVGVGFYAPAWWRRGDSAKARGGGLPATNKHVATTPDREPAAAFQPRAQTRAVRALIALTPVVVIGGFLVHPAVRNGTNSRYLIYLMAWWPIAVAVVAEQLYRAKRALGIVLVWAVGVCYGGLMLVEDPHTGWPRADDLVQYLKAQDEFDYFYADYWDAYRFTFLTGRRVRGVAVDWRNHRFDKLRIPEYKEQAESAQVVGYVVRDDFWNAPLGFAGEPVFQSGHYRVYLSQRQAGRRRPF